MHNIKEFKPTSWSIDNKTSIWVLTIILCFSGIFSYMSLPKEKFPDIVIPTIFVQTIYPGAAPKDIENLITKPIEKKIKSISGVKKLTSSSVQDFSLITVEFGTDYKVEDAKQKVKDEVDKARSELPTDLKTEPTVQAVDFAEFPILNINISGDYSLNELKRYAEMAKDRIESMSEITRVDIIGALDREIQINVDLFRMEAANITFGDVERAVAFENMRISGGNVDMNDMKRSMSISGEFSSVDQVKNIIVRTMSGGQVYLKDIADVRDDFAEKVSYARLQHKPVITLNVIKRSGENLIDASDKCRDIMKDLQKNGFPQNLHVTLTGDQSTQTRITLHDLINTIIIGFILVTVILMFFMGVTNAIFVGLSVPLSCFLAFLVMPSIGFSLNMIVLFSFLLALGIVVDDAIVVIENTHRVFKNGKVPIVQAAKLAAGEVFLPVLSGTLTTLAPFVPLAFWGGIIGKFMFYLPVTLIITLLASLLVAYIINPVFAVQFMKPHVHDDSEATKEKKKKKFRTTTLLFMAVAMVSYLTMHIGAGNFAVFLYLLYLLNKFVLHKAINNWQNNTWPKVQNRYQRFITWCLSGRRPQVWLAGTILLFIFSVVITGVRKPKVVFFPQSEPNFVYVYLNLPIGTDAKYTDSITRILEDRVYSVVGENNPMVESVISNVAVGASDPNDNDRSIASNKAKVTVAFVEFSKRGGKSTAQVLENIRKAVKGIPGAEITAEKENNGPPVGKPVSVEIMGDDLEQLTVVARDVKRYLDSLKIDGVEELKSDLQASKPEVVVNINRDRASREGISTAQIGMEIRTALFGKEISKYRDDNDDYPIVLRLDPEHRQDLNTLRNLKITYRDMAVGGMIRQVPLSAVADFTYGETYGAIKRKNMKRLVTLGSNVLGGYNPNDVVKAVETALKDYNFPAGMEWRMGGEQENQKETSGFLGNAMLISLGLILIILVTQFNSISKPILILSEIFFSIIGVLLGLAIFDMSISIVMTGVGIVALAGIVVRNGILLVEFTDILRERGMPLREAIILAGRTRLTPVLLTASATILGLIPLAVGLNMDFGTLFSELNPHIYFGGDSVAFWGPLSWTMIFGLGFATFLTLVLVPVMYLLNEKFKKRVFGWFGKQYNYDAKVRTDVDIEDLI